MKQPIQLTREQQQEFSTRLSSELQKITMSWDNDLRKWYDIAIHALDFLRTPNVPMAQQSFIELFQQEKTGLNMNVVSVLADNLEKRSAHEMGYATKQWAEVLILNNKIGNAWEQLAAKPREKVLEHFQEENRKAKLMAGTGVGLQMIKGEA